MEWKPTLVAELKQSIENVLLSTASLAYIKWTNEQTNPI